MKPKIAPNCNQALALTASELGLRLNGKRLNEFRDCEIVFGESYGSCEVIFSPGTRVFTQISGSVGEPNENRPGEGIITVSCWISPTATGEMGGGGNQKPALIARTVEKIFKEHRVVDLESLCILFGEKVWVIRIDIHILDTNGGLAEAAALSVLAGLLTFKLPETKIEEKEVTVLKMDDSIPVPLHIYHLPILLSFALTPGKKIISDPDQQEEEIFPGKVVIGVNDCRELCYLHVTTGVDYDILSEITKLAEKKCMERIKWLKEEVRKEGERRKTPAYLLTKTEDELRITGSVIQI